MDVQNIIFGVLFFCLGLVLIIYKIKHPFKKIDEEDINKLEIRGFIGALGFMLLGVLLIYNELKK